MPCIWPAGASSVCAEHGLQALHCLKTERAVWKGDASVYWYMVGCSGCALERPPAWALQECCLQDKSAPYCWAWWLMQQAAV